MRFRKHERSKRVIISTRLIIALGLAAIMLLPSTSVCAAAIPLSHMDPIQAIKTNDIPYMTWVKWFICLFLVGSSIYELKECVEKKRFSNGLLAIIGIIITLFLVPYIFKL